MSDIAVFISHSRSDDHAVNTICEKFTQAGIGDIWVDHRNGLLVGVDWINAIQRALVSCRAFLLILSPRSAISPSCINEWLTALELKKPLYVALIEHIDPKIFPWRLRSIQWANLERSFEKDMNELIAAIQERREPFFDRETVLAENISETEKLNQALEIAKRTARNALSQESGFEYGLALRNLGDTYYDLALGSLTEREINLLRALNYFGQAFHHLRTVESIYSALTESDLANVYCELATVDEPQINLHYSIEMYRTANNHIADSDYSSVSAMINNNLSNAFGELAKYEDTLANLQSAIDVLQKALGFYTPAREPAGYASTKNNLGNIYRQLAQQENRATNLQNARDAYEEAARVANKPGEAVHYATAQANLGVVYRELADLENTTENKRKYFELARNACRLALQQITSEKSPLDYLKVQNILGNVYRAWAQVEDKIPNLQRAIKAFEASLGTDVPPGAPFDVAGVYGNLGDVHRLLANEGVEREHNLQEAAKALEQSRNMRSQELVPLDYAETQTLLGIVYAEMQRFPEAITCWTESENRFRKEGILDRADTVLEFVNRAKQRLP
ncbi:MAG: toll/interleukin-1 receptor domain-containing protein [Aggregatilineales bacterium]